MLFKSHSLDYLEDFGLVSGKNIYLYEAGRKTITKKMALSPVVRTNVLWLDKDVKIRCHVASTVEDKVAGLNKYSSLEENEGLLFPYPGGETVTFHQGGVPYSLDVVFLKDNMIAHMVEKTDHTANEQWKCEDCDTVIEVNGGFCATNNVALGDRVMYSAVSETDIYEVDQENLSAMTAFADLI